MNSDNISTFQAQEEQMSNVATYLTLKYRLNPFTADPVKALHFAILV